MTWTVFFLFVSQHENVIFAMWLWTFRCCLSLLYMLFSLFHFSKFLLFFKKKMDYHKHLFMPFIFQVDTVWFCMALAQNKHSSNEIYSVFHHIYDGCMQTSEENRLNWISYCYKKDIYLIGSRQFRWDTLSRWSKNYQDMGSFK